MTSEIITSRNTYIILDKSALEPEVISSYTEESALEFKSNSNKTPSAGITGWERAQSYTNVRRDATEGSLLVRKMNSYSQQFGAPLQTTNGLSHQAQLGERMKNININVAADKFLLGTMGALSYNEEAGNPVTASPADDTGYCNAAMAFIEADSSSRISCNTSKVGAVSGDRYTCKEVCSPQKKAKQNLHPSRPPLLPPCRVCGDRASGYHYGVNTCEACKGFFRRSICKAEPYVCTGTGDCKTMAGKRTACSHCRFKRCIAVGMSKTAIKTGRYTHELRSKNILEVKRLQKQASDESPERPEENSSGYNDANYTEYKNELLRKMMLEDTLGTLLSGQKMLYEFLDDYYNDELIKERQLSVYKNYMERKRKLLLERENETVNAEHLTADYQSLETESPDHKINDKQTSKITAQESNCYSQAQSSSQSIRKDLSTLPNTPNSQICPPEVNSNMKKLTASSNDSLSTSDIDKNIENKDLNLCSNQPLNLSVQNSRADSSLNINAENTRSEADVTETGNEMSRKKSGNSVLPPTETLRAEVMTKIVSDLEQGVQGMLAFAKSLPGFSDLPSSDQVSLVKAARFDIWYIGHIRCFNVELRVGACEWQFHADELAQVWGDSMVDLAFTLSRVAKLLDLTKQETAALRAVCLTFPDRCMDLQNRTEVEHMHDNMLEVFKYVACKTRSNYNNWFTKIINFLVLLREFGVKFEAVSSKLTLDWSVLKDNPVLLSVFLS
ncbi:nuclear receptor subfamily 1 group D member 1-like [Ruditapes philippinarum]|uniref:nuclear receptor subfamily 1 group D member 1-like n=1 Tax=Ruditapes philippinarum TaxID=129788 RepID=UPI00295A9762|nr:nuclear receptor subfamily 1 group D member 1-like [Ruditapes philippinarum]XP_060559470.1 nuclear receptor subfamily 1 group D member 1-like [Ruditapes philippinarum]XP_060559472.1 nuclear receptor subfamily 1 group D member 1-like [Ruditapes philippinarum]